MSGEWRMERGIERAGDQIVSRLARVAGCNDARGELLPIDSTVSARGVVWPDIADTKSGRFSSSQHCRRPWPRAHPSVHSVPSDFPRLVEGIGNTPSAVNASRYLGAGTWRSSSEKLSRLRKNAARSNPHSATEDYLMVVFQPYSPFAIRHSRIAEQTNRG